MVLNAKIESICRLEIIYKQNYNSFKAKAWRSFDLKQNIFLINDEIPFNNKDSKTSTNELLVDDPRREYLLQSESSLQSVAFQLHTHVLTQRASEEREGKRKAT